DDEVLGSGEIADLVEGNRAGETFIRQSADGFSNLCAGGCATCGFSGVLNCGQANAHGIIGLRGICFRSSAELCLIVRSECGSLWVGTDRAGNGGIGHTATSSQSITSQLSQIA